MDWKLFSLLGIYLILNSGYSLIGPFYSILASSRGGNNSLIGLCLSALGISQIVCGLFVEKLLPHFGKTKMLGVGCILYSIGVICFGTLQ